MIALVRYWRDQCFDAYTALLEIERRAEAGASPDTIARLARQALTSPAQIDGSDESLATQ